MSWCSRPSVCGHGPSGRNGGFCESCGRRCRRCASGSATSRAGGLRRRRPRASAAIGEWCEKQGVDAWYRRRATCMVVDRRAGGATREAMPRGDGAARAREALDGEAVRARCRSPALPRAGRSSPTTATVQPARLALGLRRRLLERGALDLRALARARAARERPGRGGGRHGVGRVRAEAAVLAIGRGRARRAAAASAAHGRLLATSSSPSRCPTCSRQIGWTGGECVTDGRLLVHYFRTTRDGRIAFGWGGGRIAYGARLDGRAEVDAESRPARAARWSARSRRSRTARSPTPGVVRSTCRRATCRRSAAWPGSGPATRSATPATASARPTLPGGSSPRLALGARRRRHRPRAGRPAPAFVPPEPFAWVGGMVVRRALVRAERSLDEGRRPDPLTRAVAAAPRALGMHVSR